MQARQVQSALKEFANPTRAGHSQRYFKTAPGEYGEGDRFIGVSVPAIRKLARQFRLLPLTEIRILLYSPIHEERLLALIILVHQFQSACKINRKPEQARIYKFYLQHYRQVNNWDLVDTSCRDIVGAYLLDKSDRDILYRWASSKHLWKKRIAIISTGAFIRQQQFDDTLQLAELLLHDKHDLIHKAVGWMLREVGKLDNKRLLNFLDTHHRNMSRTMLRYALEKYPDNIRKAYLNTSIKNKRHA